MDSWWAHISVKVILATNNPQKDKNKSPSVLPMTGHFLLRYFDLGANNITSLAPRGVSQSCRLFSEIREQTPSSISSASGVSLGSPVFVRQLLITVNENTGHRWETTNLSLQASFSSWIWRFGLNHYTLCCHTIGPWKLLCEILTKTVGRSCCLHRASVKQVARQEVDFLNKWSTVRQTHSE